MGEISIGDEKIAHLSHQIKYIENEDSADYRLQNDKEKRTRATILAKQQVHGDQNELL